MSSEFRILPAVLFGADLIRRRPVHLLVLVGVIYAAGVAGNLAIYRAFPMTYIEVSVGFVVALMALQFGLGLLWLTAALRIALRPDARFYLPIGLGPDELRMLGAMIVPVLVGFPSYAIGNVLTLSIWTQSTLTGLSPPVSTAVLLLSVAVVGVLGLYVVGRLATGLALTARDRRLWFTGWSATRGAGLTLLAAHLLILAAYIATAISLGALVGWVNGDGQGVLDAGRLWMFPGTNLTMYWIKQAVDTVFGILMLGPIACFAVWDSRRRVEETVAVFADVAAGEPS